MFKILPLILLLSVQVQLQQLVVQNAVNSGFSASRMATVELNGLVYTYGGWGDGKYLGAVYRHSIKGLNVTSEFITLLPKRVGHTGVAHDGLLIFFGGLTDGVILNPLIFFNPETGVRKFVNANFSNGTDVPSRTDHTAVVVKNYMWVIGGLVAGVGYSQDIVRMNLDTFIWETVNLNGLSPRGCALHTSTLLIDGISIFVFGGFTLQDSNYVSTNDAYILNTDTYHSVLIQVNSSIPARAAHSAVLIPDVNEVMIYGGSSTSYEIFADYYFFDPASYSWNNNYNTSIVTLPKREFHKAILIDSSPSNFRIAILGGWNGLTMEESAHIITRRKIITLQPMDMAVILSVNTLLLLLQLSIGYLFFYKKKSPIIFASSFLFLMIMVVGFCLGYVSVYFWVVDSDVMCALRVWAISYAFTLVFSSLFSKTWRIYRLFNAAAKLQIEVITNRDLLLWVGMFMSFETVFLFVWQVSYPNYVEVRVNPNSLDQANYHCKPSSIAFPILSITIKGAILLFGCFLAFAVRKVQSEYNESRYIMFALYNILVVTAVAFVLILLLDLTLLSSFYLQTILVMFVTTTVWLPLWVPKLYFIATGKEKWTKSTGTGTGTNESANSTTQME